MREPRKHYSSRADPFLIFEICRILRPKNFDTTADAMYALITKEFNLKISRMNDWLESRQPLPLPLSC